MRAGGARALLAALALGFHLAPHAQAPVQAPGQAQAPGQTEAQARVRAQAQGHGQARLLVVSGIGGEQSYSQQFRTWALAMLDAARDRLGLAPDRVLWLCEEPQQDPGRCAGKSTREAVLAALAGMPLAAADPGMPPAAADSTMPPAAATPTKPPTPAGPVMLLLIGHGTARDGRALFNLPGPDLTAADLATALERFAGTSLAVVNTTPASSPFVDALAGNGRVVITATSRSGENDHTRFAGHFVAAYGGSAADADKDGRVSLLEAFDFAARQVRAEYAGKQQVATEHPQLDDDGDGVASREPGVDAADGPRAAVFHLAAASARPDSPRQQALERQAQAILEQLASLRQRRVALKPHVYERNLEALLVGLALNRRAVREDGP